MAQSTTFFSLLGGDPDDLAGPVHDESYLARKKNKHAGMPHDRRWRAVVPLPNWSQHNSMLLFDWQQQQ